MNELFLYEVCKAILKHSIVLQGRFFVAEGYGNDLNVGNYNDIIKDALGSYKPMERKYPVSVMMPPLEIVESYAKGWSRFKIDQFFLTTSGYTGVGELKNHNRATNVGEHAIQQDWKDMRQVAGDFRVKFDELIKKNGYQKYLYSATDSVDIYRRVSNMNNDNLNGVHLSYEVKLNLGCMVQDYYEPTSITLPPLEDIHPSHLH